MSLAPIGIFVIPYLIGSIPTGYWLGKIWKGIDVRQFGSGNLGATNVFRVLGWKAGLLTLVIDVLKGLAAVGVASLSLPTFNYNSYVETSFLHSEPLFLQFPLQLQLPVWIGGVSAILGHSFSPFVKFRGGKGVATAAGVLFTLMPPETTIALMAFALVFAFCRIVSLSSIIAAIVLALSTFVLSHHSHVKYFASFVALFIIWRHRENIVRLLNGTEKPLRSNEQTN